MRVQRPKVEQVIIDLTEHINIQSKFQITLGVVNTKAVEQSFCACLLL